MPAAANQTNTPATTLQLAPPREPLPEPFWRSYGWAVVALALLIGAAVGLWLRIARRTKPTLSIPPAIQARRALEALRGRAPSDALVIDVAGILRQFLVGEFNLPAHELTTTELANAVRGHPTINGETASDVEAFLRRCDAMKFAARGTLAETDLIAEALDLVNRVDAARADVKAVGAAPPIIASR